MDAPPETAVRTFTVLADCRRLLFTGSDIDAAIAKARAAYRAGEAETVVIFADATGDRTEVDVRDDAAADAAVRAWAAPDVDPDQAAEAAKRRGPGRPKLGVVSREVSLLPRHWEWLGARPEGASAALRRLVDEARRRHASRDRLRRARDAAYKFMSVVGGDLPGFEETARDLYAARYADADARLERWPRDLRAHARALIARAAALEVAAAHEADERARTPRVGSSAET